MSSPQTINLNLVFDYEYYAGDGSSSTAGPVTNEYVTAILVTSQGLSAAPITNIVPKQVVAATDGNGYWQMYLQQLTGYYWLITTPTRQIRVTGAAGQASQHLAS